MLLSLTKYYDIDIKEKFYKLPKDFKDTMDNFLNHNPKFILKEWDNCIVDDLKMRFITQNKNKIIKAFK